MDSDYADDLAVMDNTEKGLQESSDIIAYYTSYAGLKINAKKTHCMAISKCASQRPYTERDSIKLTVEGNLLNRSVTLFIFVPTSVGMVPLTEILTSGSSVLMVRSTMFGRYGTVEL